MTMNLQRTVRAKNAITLLLKEVISIQFDQNLPQGVNWPTDKSSTEYDRRRKTNRRQKKNSEVKFVLPELIKESSFVNLIHSFIHTRIQKSVQQLNTEL
jgi:hypothetical protein